MMPNTVNCYGATTTSYGETISTFDNFIYYSVEKPESIDTKATKIADNARKATETMRLMGKWYLIMVRNFVFRSVPYMFRKMFSVSGYLPRRIRRKRK